MITPFPALLGAGGSKVVLWWRWWCVLVPASSLMGVLCFVADYRWWMFARAWVRDPVISHHNIEHSRVHVPRLIAHLSYICILRGHRLGCTSAQPSRQVSLIYRVTESQTSTTLPHTQDLCISKFNTHTPIYRTVYDNCCLSCFANLVYRFINHCNISNSPQSSNHQFKIDLKWNLQYLFVFIINCYGSNQEFKIDLMIRNLISLFNYYLS